MSSSSSSHVSVSSSSDDASKLDISSLSDKYPNIKILDYSDVDKAALTLADAFSNDALAKLLVSDLESHQLKRDFEIALYKAYLNQHISKGICLGINELDDEFETVAIWSCPDSHERGLDSFTTLMESGYGTLWNMGCEKTRNKVFYGMLPLLHDSCERILSSDSRFKNKDLFTLVYVGSTARAQGKGNTRKMFQFMFDNFVDLEGTNNICYLESSAVTNIPIYERFGFKYYEDIILGEKSEDAVEGEDYAAMNVMIRGVFGHDWTKDENTISSKL